MDKWVDKRVGEGREDEGRTKVWAEQQGWGGGE